MRSRSGRRTSSWASLLRPSDSTLPTLHPRSLGALCREFSSLSRQAAMPLCEEQRLLAQQMASVESLCARVLYLLALRATDLSSSAASLRELPDVVAHVRETRLVVQRCVERADALAALLPNEGGGALS